MALRSFALSSRKESSTGHWSGWQHFLLQGLHFRPSSMLCSHLSITYGGPPPLGVLNQ